MTYIQQVEPKSYFPGQIATSNPYSVTGGENVAPRPILMGKCVIFTPAGYSLPVTAAEVNTSTAVSILTNNKRMVSYDANLNPIISTSDSIQSGGEMSACTLGDIAVTVEQEVQEGQPCFIRFNDYSGGLLFLGSFRADADVQSSAATAAQHPTWFYLTSAAAGTTALVRVK
jgi:hypothetical protein